ncbi:hypothetical protein [Vibrio mediterranei]|uniref:hypothetical protein n=1 Tax=Vibrio mediterranei TaxID=689 RepID=UPI004069118A
MSESNRKYLKNLKKSGRAKQAYNFDHDVVKIIKAMAVSTGYGERKVSDFLNDLFWQLAKTPSAELPLGLQSQLAILSPESFLYQTLCSFIQTKGFHFVVKAEVGENEKIVLNKTDVIKSLSSTIEIYQNCLIVISSSTGYKSEILVNCTINEVSFLDVQLENEWRAYKTMYEAEQKFRVLGREEI